MDRHMLPVLLLLGAGCATTQATEAPPPPPPPPVQVVNRSALDVAACPVPSPSLPVSNDDTVAGMQLAVRPAIEECLIDPRHRTDKEATAVLTTTVTEAGTKHEVSGTHLSEAGSRCVEAAAARTLQLPPVAKGSKPARAVLRVPEQGQTAPFVVFGVNEPSDIVGTLRLTQAAACECYAGFTDKAPPTVRAWVQVPKGSQTVTAVRWTQQDAAQPPAPPAPEAAEAAEAGTAVAQAPAAPALPADFTADQRRLAECLTGKLVGLTVPQASGYSYDLKYDFEFLDSRFATPAENATPTLALTHLEVARIGAQGEKVVAYGVWTAQTDRLNALIKRYNPRNKKYMKQLREQCDARVQASAAWLSELDTQLALDRRMAELAQQQAAAAPEWSAAATSLTQRVGKSEAERAEVEAAHKGDAEACRKL